MPVTSLSEILPAAPCRVILLGGNGLLGGAFRRAWAGHSRFSVTEFPRAELNLTRLDQIQHNLEGLQPNGSQYAFLGIRSCRFEP